jgi:hypothetical protein
MATSSVTHTFANAATIEAAEHNTNFDDLVNFLNNQVAHLDGTKVFTAIPSGPASDPTTDNQFARKAYVDNQVGAGGHTHPFSEITGTATASQIPNLSADKITADTLGTARIPNLSANKITSDTLGTARIPTIAASKVSAGTFSGTGTFIYGNGTEVVIGRSSMPADRAGIWEVDNDSLEIYRQDTTASSTILFISSDEGGTRNQKARFTIGGDLELEGTVVPESDARLKKNVTPLTAEEAWERLDQSWVKFDWAREGRGSGRGVIAQNVRGSARELIRETYLDNEGEARYGFAYTELLPDMARAVQDLRERVEELEAA